MLQIEWSGRIITGARVRSAELLRFGPCFEGGFALPHCMGGIERMVFGLGPFEQVELDEPRHAIEIGIAAQPYFLESFFGTSLHTKPIHGNEHRLFPSFAKAKSYGALCCQETDLGTLVFPQNFESALATLAVCARARTVCGVCPTPLTGRRKSCTQWSLQQQLRQRCPLGPRLQNTSDHLLRRSLPLR